jgi:hypothetical protein
VNQSQTADRLLPCPQGIFAGILLETTAIRRFTAIFMPLPQVISANSLCCGGREFGDPRWEFFTGDREFSKPAANHP